MNLSVEDIRLLLETLKTKNREDLISVCGSELADKLKPKIGDIEFEEFDLIESDALDATKIFVNSEAKVLSNIDYFNNDQPFTPTDLNVDVTQESPDEVITKFKKKI